jgi:uncharacterized protein YdaU (DUF1376 family)
MHYYKRNIGDYAKKAGRLSMLQHGSYTLLIDACYDRERFPTMEEAIEWTWASSSAEIEAVEFVLKKFFTLRDGIYVQSRIEEDLQDYHKKAEVNQRIAIEREANRKKKSTNRAPDVDEPPPNHKPLTKNQEPRTKDESEERRKTRRHSDEDEKCARWLYGQILNVLPTAKPPNWNTWGDDVRLMREVDKRTHHEICELLQWATKDTFWCRNILSPSKLREKWDQLSVNRAAPKAPARPSMNNLGGNAPKFDDPFAS